MARKKKGRRVSKTSSNKKRFSFSGSVNKAQRNFSLFLILTIVSVILYNFTTNPFFVSFFGIVSIIFGFVAFAFLISLIVLWVAGKK